MYWWVMGGTVFVVGLLAVIFASQGERLHDKVDAKVAPKIGFPRRRVKLRVPGAILIALGVVFLCIAVFQ